MPKVIVLYGSQTGCAESIAKRLFQEAKDRGCDAELKTLNAFLEMLLDWKKTDIAIMVCSTTGNGDPPENAAKCWRKLKRKSQPNDLLQHVQYTMLGLGDTNYDKFCHMGHCIDKRVRELGAKEVYGMGAADEATGLEDVVEPWIEGLWPAILKEEKLQTTAVVEVEVKDKLVEHHSIVPKGVQSYDDLFGRDSIVSEPVDVPRFRPSTINVTYIKDDEWKEDSIRKSSQPIPCSAFPFMAKIANARSLCAQDSTKQVMEMELDIEHSGISYKVGDSIGIRCPNPSDVVEFMIKRLDLDGNNMFTTEDGDEHVQSIEEAFTKRFNLTVVPKKSALRHLACYCTDEKEKFILLNLSSKSGAVNYQKFVMAQKLTVPEVLEMFPSCHPPLDHMLCILPALCPRYYSIASSPLLQPNRLKIAFTVVDYIVEGTNIARKGVCTTWLQRQCDPKNIKTSVIPLFLRDTEEFSLPADCAAPLILIGPGTGVAPFIGFLQHREQQMLRGEKDDICSGCWRGSFELTMQDDQERTFGETKLFFGCRNESKDWIYQDEMQQFCKNGTLSSLYTAFSRDQEHKIYVQHLMSEVAQQLFDMICMRNAYVYVCGDGMHMAKAVHKCLVDIFVEHGSMDQCAAEKALKDLQSRQRYVRDFWS